MGVCHRCRCTRTGFTSLPRSRTRRRPSGHVAIIKTAGICRVRRFTPEESRQFHRQAEIPELNRHRRLHYVVGTALTSRTALLTFAASAGGRIVGFYSAIDLLNSATPEAKAHGAMAFQGFCPGRGTVSVHAGRPLRAQVCGGNQLVQ